MKKAFVLIMILWLLGTAALAEGLDVTGTWKVDYGEMFIGETQIPYDPKDAKVDHTYVLNTDGTAVYNGMEVERKGAWELQGDQILLKFDDRKETAYLTESGFYIKSDTMGGAATLYNYFKRDEAQAPVGQMPRATLAQSLTEFDGTWDLIKENIRGASSINEYTQDHMLKISEGAVSYYVHGILVESQGRQMVLKDGKLADPERPGSIFAYLHGEDLLEMKSESGHYYYRRIQ